MIKRLTTGLSAAAVTGALVLATPGLAQAAAYDRGNADTERVARDADGDAEARAHANRDGAFSVRGEAVGGGADTPIGGQDTLARSVSSLNKRVPVADGTYRVVVTYVGAQGTDTDRGAGDSALRLRSLVEFGGERLTRSANLTADKTRHAETFVISIPEGESGRLRVNAALRGVATAPADGDIGRYRGSVDDVVVVVKRIAD